MMSLKPTFISIALLAMCAGGAYAAESGVCTLDSCRALALKNNKQLRVRAEAVRMTGYQKDEAFAAYLPAIDFNGGYTYNQKKISIFDSDQLLPTKTFDLQTQSYQFNLVKNPMTGEPVKGPDGQYIPETVALIPKDAMTYDIHNVFFGAVTLTQPIYMGGKIVAMNKLTHYAEDAARALHNAEAQNLIYAVDAAYWMVVSLKAKQELAESYVQLLDTLHSNVEAMVREGVATKSDLLTVDVKLNAAQVDLVKVQNGLVLSRMALAQVCGLPVDTPMHLADEDNDIATTTSEIALSYNMNDVYARRQDLRALENGVQVLRQREKAVMADMLPKVALIGAYSFSNPNMFDGFKKRFSGAFSVGAMVSIPIWHWGGNYNKYRAAKSATRMAELEVEDSRELIDLQVRQSAFKTQEAVKTYHMTLTNIEKANENLRQANLGFREGVMTTDNVMEAQTAWLKANSEKIDALIDVHLCDVYLAKVLGTLPYPTEY
ncbi:MAG: TolC family protein [Muribaculaceae bacterium]|nr:TolC family protein [Muribaculaceae bacterium]